jgi:hypothetical protein
VREEPKTLCVDCKTEAPPSNGDLTLLSKLGWRCSRGVDIAGHSVADWRCPSCADKYKKNRALRGMASGFMPAVAVPKKRENE